jgi:membrane-associated phospholipid phosphatase
MPHNARTPLFAAALCAAAIVPLAVAAYAVGPVEHLDLRLLLHFGAPESSGTRGFEGGVARFGGLGPTLFFLAIIFGLGWFSERRREALAALAVVAGANLTTQVLKLLLAHPRNTGIPGYLPWSTAFPSGHTTAATSIAAALFLVVPARWRWPAAIVGLGYGLAVGAATVAVRWHYPTDVLGGLLVVGAWTFAAIAALRLRPGARGAPAGEREGRRSERFAVSTE